MKKLFLICLGFAFLSAPLFGQNRFVDNAAILNGSQAQNLREILDDISLNHNFDLVIVTETNIGGVSPVDYADDFFDYNGYGLGKDFDGCLFLHVTGERDYCFSTSGRGEKIFTEGAIDKLEKEILVHLRNENYYEAYLAFAKTAEAILAQEGKSFLQQHFGVILIVIWVISLLIGFIVVAVWKKGMNTALQQTQAASYIVPNTLAFADKRDRFLYSTVSKTAKPKSSSSSGGGSHTSSSGRSHGGRSGKY